LSLTADDDQIKKSEEKDFNIYKLTYADLLAYDCGLNEHPKFPEQRNIPTTKPSLDEMIKASEDHASKTNRKSPLYNIEIKRTKEGDNIYHPEFKEFTDLTMEVIQSNGVASRTSVQCFDLEVLQYLKTKYPEQTQVFLVANKKSTKENITELGHTPHIYSPYWKMIDEDVVAYCKRNNIRLIPWTVNEVDDMKKIINFGVDGIITDYPDRLIKLLHK